VERGEKGAVEGTRVRLFILLKRHQIRSGVEIAARLVHEDRNPLFLNIPSKGGLDVAGGKKEWDEGSVSFRKRDSDASEISRYEVEAVNFNVQPARGE